MLGLMMYTFVTMVGGNPHHDPYGFRYWNNPVRFLFQIQSVTLLMFEGCVCRVSRSGRYRSLPGSALVHDSRLFHVCVLCPQCLERQTDSRSMVGPEFISMAAGEAKNPRRLMGRAFSSFVWRLMFFFLGGALCVGIVIPYNDRILHETIAGEREGSGTGAA